MQIKGTATVLGDDIDTDVIFPGRYLAVLDPADQAKHLFEALGADVRDRAAAGGVVVAGWNFGCGSSREHAVTSMLGANVKVVVAKSFSRIFFRNAVNNGLPVVVCPEAVDGLADGDAVAVDLAAGTATFPGGRAAFAPLPPELLGILAAGGLWASAKQRAAVRA
jgi:3-isopropylmalate/(R)-2-methylmalate dehydratase small subunit